jgi:hypothetical protein
VASEPEQCGASNMGRFDQRGQAIEPGIANTLALHASMTQRTKRLLVQDGLRPALGEELRVWRKTRADRTQYWQRLPDPRRPKGGRPKVRSSRSSSYSCLFRACSAQTDDCRRRRQAIKPIPAAASAVVAGSEAVDTVPPVGASHVGSTAGSQ